MKTTILASAVAAFLPLDRVDLRLIGTANGIRDHAARQ